MMEYTELKIRLMQLGAVFTDNAKAHMCKNKFGQIVFHDYATTGGVVVELAGQVYVNVPAKHENTPFCIDYAQQQFVLTVNGQVLEVTVNIMPVPQFALNNVLLENDIPVRDLVMTHAHRLRISPIHGCSYHCQFCTCNRQKYVEISREYLDQAVQIALADSNTSPEHILISGGTPEAEEKTYQYLNEVYKYFPEKYPDYEFDVMLSPRGLHAGEGSAQDYEEFLDYLHNTCNIQTLSVNLELYHDGLRKKYIPEKWNIGINSYRDFIRQAVDMFGRGKIRSSLIVGLEEMEDTLRGVEELCSWGCIPVLSAFVPDKGTDMASYPQPAVEFLTEVVSRSAEIAEKYGTVLGPLCRPCTHNSLTKEVGGISI